MEGSGRLWEGNLPDLCRDGIGENWSGKQSEYLPDLMAEKNSCSILRLSEFIILLFIFSYNQADQAFSLFVYQQFQSDISKQTVGNFQ